MYDDLDKLIELKSEDINITDFIETDYYDKQNFPN